ncbi:MAG: DUF6054 family protein [Oscillospiraceae bacterium]|nr:DUF6054 family protein [Oscillospiraceae bacterium]
MAKFEAQLNGDFQTILREIEQGIVQGSASATLENGSNFDNGSFRCAVRVFERHSMASKSRVSMNVTLLGDGQRVFLSAITAGGSAAIFFKINTIGEESFIREIERVTARFR